MNKEDKREVQGRLLAEGGSASSFGSSAKKMDGSLVFMTFN